MQKKTPVRHRGLYKKEEKGEYIYREHYNTGRHIRLYAYTTYRLRSLDYSRQSGHVACPAQGQFLSHLTYNLAHFQVPSGAR